MKNKNSVEIIVLLLFVYSADLLKKEKKKVYIASFLLLNQIH
jgi:hypothetical protein